jgi:hypothetical protein
MIDRLKFSQIRDEIIAEKGDLSFFALFLREGIEDRWDLLVSASWLDRDKAVGRRYLTRKLIAKLSDREIVELSRIVIIERADPGLRKLLNEITVENGEIRELKDLQFAGQSLSRAMIFAANSEAFAAMRRGA